MKKSFSLHKIYQKENCPFDESEYSKFKFGNTLYAQKFAKELFTGFSKLFKELLLQQSEIVLLPSPYCSIPTASNFLCSHFKELLNRFLFENNKGACIEGKIYRNQTYVEDYGNMDFEQRLDLISNDTYYIDNKFIENKCCIFIDDIKITGSHEKTIDKILEQFNIKGKFIFLYYAELINKAIHPNIENHYNYFTIKEVDDIIEILKNEYFRYNTRIVKYILLMNRDDFYLTIQNISADLQNRLLDLAISNNYHRIDEYKTNIKNLKSILWESTYKKDKEKTLILQNLQLA